MKAKLIRGRVAVITKESDEFGEKYDCERVLD